MGKGGTRTKRDPGAKEKEAGDNFDNTRVKNHETRKGEDKKATSDSEELTYLNPTVIDWISSRGLMSKAAVFVLLC